MSLKLENALKLAVGAAKRAERIKREQMIRDRADYEASVDRATDVGRCDICGGDCGAGHALPF